MCTLIVLLFLFPGTSLTSYLDKTQILYLVILRFNSKSNLIDCTNNLMHDMYCHIQLNILIDYFDDDEKVLLYCYEAL
jgi:hypothetical protein